MRKRSKCKAAFALLSLLVLLTGCTYESGEKKFALEADKATEAQPIAQTVNARQILTEAIQNAKTNDKAQKFWYKGHVKNTLLSRTTTSMFEGAVVMNKGYNVDARIARQDYQYYRINDKRYVKVNGNWMTAGEDPLPFDVLSGFDDLLPLMDRAEQVKDSDEVYGEDCYPFQVKMTVSEWLQLSQSSLFAPLKEELAGRTDMSQILDNSTVKLTIWVGKNDHLFHQLETWIILPFPDGGYMDQQILFSFYKYDDPGIQIKEPEEVEKYLLY